jgi:hypothetical protein
VLSPWNSFPVDTHFLVKFRRVIQFYKLYCKQRVEARCLSEMRLQVELEDL